MITIKDLAKNLISKHQVKESDAELFIQQMVEVINDGLLNDRQVKIKGFGTFKLQTMKERDSINVNTGERVTIGEHDKVTFTPDNTMKDLINKPFAQFETVIVAEDSPLLDDSFEVNMDDIEEEEDTTVNVEPVEKEKTIIKEEPIVEEEPVNEKEPTVATEPAEEPVNEEEPTVAPEPEEEEEEVPVITDDVISDVKSIEADAAFYSRQIPHFRTIFIYYGIIINVVVALIAFTIGYLLADNQNAVLLKTEIVKPAEKPVTAPAKKIPAKETAAKKQKADTIKPVKTDSVKLVKAKEEKPADAIPQPMHQYDKDARVRTGAYYIMGTERIVTAKEGQTLKSISKNNLGPGMECYTEAYNGYKEPKAGDKVKIPSLKLKKLVKKHNRK